MTPLVVGQRAGERSLETFTRLRAAIEQRGDREAVLREARLSHKEWMALQRYWLGMCATEIASGRTELGERYMAAYVPEEPLVASPAALAPASSPVRAEAPRAQPSYLLNQQPAAVAPVVAPPPIYPAPAQLPAPAAPLQMQQRQAPVGSATAFAPAGFVSGPAFPFRPATPGSAPVAARPVVAPPAQPNPGSGTVLASDTPARGAATPFVQQPARPAALPTAKPAEAPFSTGTVLASAGAGNGPVVPFQSSSGPTGAAGVAPPPAPVARAAISPALTGTILAPADAGAGPATPFQHAAPNAGAPREMDLDQYAFVMAQVRFASEAELPGVLSRLRMTREKLDQLQAIWKPQLNGNFALSVQYAKALETHKQNLEARRATPGSAAPANVSAPSNVHPGPGAGQKPGK